MDYLYDHCTASASNPVPSPRVVQYPTVFAGVGQRYFVGKSGSVRFDIRTHFFSINSADGACDPSSAEASTSTSQTFTMQIGYSYYF